MINALFYGFEILFILSSAAIFLFLTYRMWINLRFLKHIHRQAKLDAAPQSRVSVLIPARNEVKTIARCVHSLTKQSHPNYEIIVLDDASSDGTTAILQQLSREIPTLKTIYSTEEIPYGWNGKSFACQRLAQASESEYLLFTDADTVHHPESIAKGLAFMQRLQLDFLSVSPTQITISPLEKVMVSFIVDFLPILGLDYQAIQTGQSQRIAANGQYILVKAAVYHDLGGHQSIRKALVDDFALARLFQAHHAALAYVNSVEMVECRMYQNGVEVWQGFSKNILLGLENSDQGGQQPLNALLFAWGYACLFVLPFAYLLHPELWWAGLSSIAYLLGLRAIFNLYLKRPADEIFTSYLAAWGVMALSLNALYKRWRGQAVIWKGRRYKV
ncbi:hydroxychlorobactene glucosyltransferase CruC [Anaerolineales bacterium]